MEPFSSPSRLVGLQAMKRLLQLGALVVVGAFLAFIYHRIDMHMRKRRARLRYGCEEPAKYPHTDRLWGSDLLKLRKQALRDGRLKALYLEQHRALGETWQEVADGGIRINTISGPNLQYMYARHMSAFRKGSNRVPSQSLMFGNSGVLLSEGEEWKWNRKLVMPTFSKYEKRTLPMLKTHVDRFMASLPRDGQTFDAQRVVKRLFLDLATDFLFGEPLGMQLPEKQQEAEGFLLTLDSALLGLNKRRQDSNLTSIKLWFDGSYAADVAKVHAFVDKRIQAALARTALGEEDKEGSYILVDAMARHIRDPEYLRGAMLQCFLPGRDSVAILVSNTLFLLARNPQHWTRIRPLALALRDEDSELSFQRLDALHPIKHVIFEALRLLGPGGGNRRNVHEDVVFPEGGGPDGKSPLFVPKGAQIQTHVPVMHRNKRFWGEDADEYRPQRFEEKDPRWEFKPFLAGPRTCPAKDQAIIQAIYIMVRLLREFETIENRDPVMEFIEMARLTTESRRGAIIALIPKNS